MGILYPRKMYNDYETFKAFLKDLGTLAPVTWLNEDYYSRTKVFEKSIKAARQLLHQKVSNTVLRS